jgi:hypothetical protein
MLSRIEKRSGGTLGLEDFLGLRGRIGTLTDSVSGSGRPCFPDREEGLLNGFFERVMGIVN